MLGTEQAAPAPAPAGASLSSGDSGGKYLLRLEQTLNSCVLRAVDVAASALAPGHDAQLRCTFLFPSVAGSRVLEACIGIVVATLGLATIGYIVWLGRFALAQEWRRFLRHLGLIDGAPTAADEPVASQQGGLVPKESGSWQRGVVS